MSIHCPFSVRADSNTVHSAFHVTQGHMFYCKVGPSKWHQVPLLLNYYPNRSCGEALWTALTAKNGF